MKANRNISVSSGSNDSKPKRDIADNIALQQQRQRSKALHFELGDGQQEVAR